MLPILQKEVPQTIYKFISLTDDKELNDCKFYSIENNEIWFSNVNKLNDPFEGLNCCYLKDFALDLYPYLILMSELKVGSDFFMNLEMIFIWFRLQNGKIACQCGLTMQKIL